MEVLGGDMRSARFRRSVAPRIAYMPQGLGRNLYAPLSVFDNVDFFGRLFDQPAAGASPPHRRAARQHRARALPRSSRPASFRAG